MRDAFGSADHFCQAEADYFCLAPKHRSIITGELYQRPSPWGLRRIRHQWFKIQQLKVENIELEKLLVRPEKRHTIPRPTARERRRFHSYGKRVTRSQEDRLGSMLSAGSRFRYSFMNQRVDSPLATSGWCGEQRDPNISCRILCHDRSREPILPENVAASRGQQLMQGHALPPTNTRFPRVERANSTNWTPRRMLCTLYF